jgi:ABC-type dipeptide/oligopeptide/nickel transport system permease subunit
MDAKLPPYSGPSASQWLGTDALGESFLRLLLQGTIYTLVDVFIAATIALLIAIIVASLGSFFRGTLSRFIFNLASLFSFSTPLIAVLLLLYSLFGNHPVIFPLTVGCLLWGSATLTIQTAIAIEAHSSYIKAARSLGITDARLFLFYLVPNLVIPIRAAWLANWPSMLSASILTAYLGAHAGGPRLGSLLKSGYELFPSCWWLWLPPTIVVSIIFTLLFLGTEGSLIRGFRR